MNRLKKSICLPQRTHDIIESYKNDNKMNYSEAVSSLILQKEPQINPANLADFQDYINSLQDKLQPEIYIVLSTEVKKLWQI